MDQNFVFGLIVGITIIYILIEIKNQCYSSSFKEIIQTLIRQASRWTVAAEQDRNPLIAVLHANYGTGYLWALKDIATDSEIKMATGIDFRKFTKNITSVQDKVTKQLSAVCPGYAPTQSYLAKIAGEV